MDQCGDVTSIVQDVAGTDISPYVTVAKCPNIDCIELTIDATDEQ